MKYDKQRATSRHVIDTELKIKKQSSYMINYCLDFKKNNGHGIVSYFLKHNVAEVHKSNRLVHEAFEVKKYLATSIQRVVSTYQYPESWE